jgi:hypothetical protein
LLLPMILGYKGIPFEKQVISICRLCPAGALEAGVPYSVPKPDGRQRLDDERLKTGILLSFLAAALVHSPAVVPDFLSARRLARALQPVQPVSSPVQSQGMRRMQPLPQPLLDGRESGSGRQRVRLHPLPRMHHLRRH